MRKLIVLLFSLFMAFSGQAETFWSENFNSVASGNIPDGWTQYSKGLADTKWRRSEAYHDYNFIGATYRRGDSGNAMSHNYNAAGDAEDWLVTPAIILPADGSFALTFWSHIIYAEDYRSNSVYISDGNIDPAAGDYTQVWHPLEYPKTPSIIDWFESTVSLSEYAGKTIYIAFVYQGDSGHVWLVDDVSIKPFIPPVSDLSIESVSTGKYSQLPVKHAAGYQFSAKIKNSGASLSSPVNLNVTADNPESYAGNATINTLNFGNEIQVSASPAFTTASAGNYTAIYTLDIADNTPGNNTATASFTVTPHTFAQDNGVYGGFAGKSEPFVAGNIYELQTGDIVSSFGLCFADASNESFQLQIYSISDDLTSNTLLYTSPEFTCSGAQANHFAEYAIEPQTLPAGKYFFALKSLASTIIGLAYDNAYGYSHSYYLENDAFVSMPVSHGNLMIRVNTIAEIDAAVTAILSPESGENLTESETVTVTVANRGSQSLSNIELQLYIDNEPIAVENYIETLLPGASVDYTFHQTVDLSEESKTYEIKVAVSVEGEEWESNNTLTKTVTHPKATIVLYGYRIYDDNISERGFVSFTSSNPQTVTPLDTYADKTFIVGSGEYVNGKMYLFTITNEEAPAHFIVLDKNGTKIIEEPIDLVPDDITYNHSTHTLYAVSGTSVLLGSTLSSVDLATGQLTKIADLSSFIYVLAANLQGDLYGVNANGNIVTIHKTTGAVSLLRTTGVTPQYVQSATFDHNTGRLFWAMSNDEDQGKLIEINPLTGFITDLGTIAGNTQLTMLYTPYTSSEDAIRPVNQLPVTVYSENGEIVVNDCLKATSVQIINPVGQTVYSCNIQSEKINIPVGKGIYFVRIQSKNSQSVHKVFVK
ncbi:MAG: choice-of-anchor J domain-containing protein [Dysgonamonadaceae bacterium]|jgi:hypothetical protein|nr:choice-of-anchor J domain-containing protein [Dysgonamonadaceae bacterium]